jgi:hypothetical protein
MRPGHTKRMGLLLSMAITGGVVKEAAEAIVWVFPAAFKFSIDGS